MTTPNLGKRIGESARFCASCRRELPATVKYFALAPGKPNGLALTCKECRDLDDTEGKPRRGAGCFQCEGMSWRRPEDGTACRCGEMFAAEAPVTLADILESPRENRTIYPNGAEGFRLWGFLFSFPLVGFA